MEAEDEAKRSKIELTPSKVLHVRNLPPDATEPELFQMGSHYGSVMRVLLLAKNNAPQTRQGFIQFANQSEASAMLEYAGQVPILFRGKQIYVQYSNRPEISQSNSASGAGGVEDDQNCRILLLTISNVLYPITVDVLSQVFSGYGMIEKIVVFVKGAGMQALVQFTNAADAQNAKRVLDAQNIYSGCCHLRIQNSTLETLTVKFNNDKTRDFTQNLPSGREEQQQQYAMAGGPAMMPGAAAPAQMYMPRNVPQAMNPAAMMYTGMPDYTGAVPGMPPQARPYGMDQSPVVLVNHLDPGRITLDMLFNIFSTCGVVQRIKILFNKRDTALVQFLNPEQADVARTALTGCPLHGRNLLVSASKHQSLQGKTDADPNSAVLFGDYTASSMHRFKGPSSRIQAAAPSSLLHISNIAHTVSELDVRTLFAPFEPILDFKFIQPKPSTTQQDRKMALVQLASAERAVEALGLLHNAPLHDVRVRISFSNSNLGRT